MATNNTQIVTQITINQPVHLDCEVSCKLDFNNFLDWRWEVSEAIICLGLKGYLDGSIAVLAATIQSAAGTTENNPNYLNWYMQDDLLLGWLRSTILVPVLAQVIYCRTSDELWASIHQLYWTPRLGHIVELQDQLLTFQRGTQSCSIYFEKMKSFANKLASLGAPICNEYLQHTILRKLGPGYARFRCWFMALPCPITLADFHRNLLRYEACLSARSEIPEASPNPDALGPCTTIIKFKRRSDRGTDNSGHRHSYLFSSQGHNGGQHSSQPPIAPAPSSVATGTHPGPSGRGRGQSPPAQQPQQAPSPQETPRPASPISHSFPLQFPVVSAESSSASNEGCIHEDPPYPRPVNQGSPSSPTS